MHRFTNIAPALLLLVLLSAAFIPLPGHGAGAGAGCSESYDLWHRALEGRWQGTWQNHFFNSSGNLTADVFIEAGCTARARLSGVFQQPGPVVVDAAFHDSAQGATISVQGHPVFGDVNITVADDGDIEVAVEGAHQNITSATATGAIANGHIDLEMELQITGFGTVTETVSLDKQFTLIQGDVDCDETVGPQDAGLLLEFAADLTGGQQSAPCPDLQEPEDTTALPWGDVNCDDAVNAVDALFLIAFQAGISITPADDGCYAIDHVIL